MHSTVDGPTISIGDLGITPQTRVVALQTPFGGIVWNRPSAVVVERDAVITRSPIVDMTRLIQAVLVACLLLGLVTTLQRKGA